MRRRLPPLDASFASSINNSFRPLVSSDAHNPILRKVQNDERCKRPKQQNEDVPSSVELLMSSQMNASSLQSSVHNPSNPFRQSFVPLTSTSKDVGTVDGIRKDSEEKPCDGQSNDTTGDRRSNNTCFEKYEPLSNTDDETVQTLDSKAKSDIERILNDKCKTRCESACSANLCNSSPAANIEVHTIQSIHILIVSWNQHAKMPLSRDIAKHLVKDRTCHLIVFSSQECENTIAKSFFFRSKPRWETTVKVAIGPGYNVLNSRSLQGIHSIIFVHHSISSMISNVKSTRVATGFFNAFGNKGAIGISFQIGANSFCVINGHLSSGQSAFKRRITEFQRINNIIVEKLGQRSAKHPPRFSIRTNINFNKHRVMPTCLRVNRLFDCFDFVFWSGDLNFRVNASRSIVDGLLKARCYDVLLNNDQLSLLMKVDPNFAGIQEGPINFRPTYKYDLASEMFDTSNKQRVPSWTDRILYKEKSSLQLLSYESVESILISDHKPVCGSFLCELT